MDQVFITRSPLFVTRTKGDDIVVMAKSEYESLNETLYLLGSKKNSERLAKGIEEFEKGKGVKRKLID